MKELQFFDCNCRIGTKNEPLPDAVELLAEMDYYGIDRALVHHNAYSFAAEATNRDLAQMLEADTEKRLTGVWTLLPDCCDELGGIEQFFAAMAKHRIKALTLDPFSHHYLPRRMVIGRIMDAARERKVPILLNAFTTMTRWQDMYDFLAEFPENIYIYAESTGIWGRDRVFRPLLETYSGFYFDTGSYWVPEGIHALVEKYGSDRILFGSGFPKLTLGGSMLQLKYSKLPEADLQKICSGNLTRILEEVEI
ncbi:MAG: amidohydrolase family protein [Lentisphaeria bacterium]|nr:amidohydrolase family protein [Lentisphaeria bacterium]